MRSRLAGLLSSALCAWLSSWSLGCGAGDECTLVGCDDEAVVTYPAGLVGEAYELVLRYDGQTSAARCADPSAPETAENPPGLECDLSGFTLRGHPLDNARAVFVTIVRVADDEVLVENVEVRLDAVGTNQPNGPDCEPTCHVRNGQLVVTAPGE